LGHCCLEIWNDFDKRMNEASCYCVLQVGSMTGMPQSLARFRVEDADELCRDLRQLDALPCRTADTVSLFYVKRGQTKLTDMLANVVSHLQCNVEFETLNCI